MSRRAVRRRRDAVELGVGVHDRPRAAVADRHLERRQDHVGELARPDRDGCQVASGAAGRVPREVLQGGDDARALEPPDVGGADGADEVRVLTDRLLGATPAVVARHVEHGCEPLVHARGPHRGADPGGHLLDQLGVEARAPGQRHRVGGGAPGGEPREALLVHEGGDAPPVRGDDLGLRRGQRPRARGGVDRRGAVRAGQLAEPVADDLGPAEAVVGHLGLVRGDAGTARVGSDPEADQLRELLLEGHPGDQVVDLGLPLRVVSCAVI